MALTQADLDRVLGKKTNSKADPFMIKQGVPAVDLKEYAMNVNSLMPVSGDIQSGVMAAQDLQKGNYGSAALNSIGLLPFIPALGAVVKNTKIGDIGFDPRFDTRKLEQEKLNNLTTKVDYPEYNIPKVSLADFEGRPFITTMSDRTNVGNLLEINGVPVGTQMQGGQGFMFDNPMAWASAKTPVNAIVKHSNILQEATGQNPLLLPWRMAPTGGDFANMTGETMLRYMSNNMSKSAQRGVNKDIKEFIPNFKGVGSEEGIDQFRTAPDKVRKRLKKYLDKTYRDEGGLSLGEARLAVSDPAQLIAQDAGIMNVGEIFAKQPVIAHSGHKAYPRGVAGQGLGTLDQDYNIFQLLPSVVKERNIIDPLNPSQRDIRALQMKPYAGILTSDLLKKLGL
jgi:hypothetical protein